MTAFLRKTWTKLTGALAGRRSGLALVAVAAIVAAGLVVPHFVWGAEDLTDKVFGTLGEIVFLILARIFQALGALFGQLLILVVGVLISVAQYNDFVNAPAVGTGWVLVRDITNMFYIMVLLLIAFGTMLGLEQYHYKKYLTKVLIAAVLVNFSRTFCGLLIDAGQVVMLTFVYGFSAAGGGNFLEAVGMNDWLAQNASPSFLAEEGSKPNLAFNAMMGMALAAVLALISLIVVVYMTVMLVIRIVYLWLLVVMSPAAFFLRAVPLKSAEKYYGEWWGMLTGQIIFGPVMAFFLWLSLSVAAQGNMEQGFPVSAVDVDGGLTEAWGLDKIKRFIIAIGLLVGGTSLATKIAGTTANMAKTVMKKAPGYATKGLKFGAGLAGKTSLRLGERELDATTGKLRRKKVQLGALAGAGLAKLQTTGAYKSLGLDKDYSKLKAKEEMAKALAATGQADKAAALREELYGEAGKKLPKDKGALRKYYENELKDHPGSIMQRAAALKLAESGALEVNELAEASGGDLALRKLLSDALKKSGKVFAGIDATKPADAMAALEDLYATSSRGDKTKFARQAVDGMMRGRDGELRDANSTSAIQVIDVDDFKEFPGELKQKLLNALDAGMNDTRLSATMRAEMQRKHTELAAVATGMTSSAADFSTAEKSRLVKEQGLLVGAGAAAKAFQGLDPDTGNFDTSNPANLADFQSFMSSAANRKAFVKAIDKNVLLANGANNDVARTLLANLTPAELAAMVSDTGDNATPHDNFLSVIQAAKLNAGTMPQAATMVTDYRDNANPLGRAFADRTYFNESVRFVSGTVGDVADTAATVGGVAAGAAAATALGPVAGVAAIGAGAWAGGKVGTGLQTAGLHRFASPKKIAEDAAKYFREKKLGRRNLGRGIQRRGMRV